jgi:mannose-6-phosphate isomerase-like protein (cupin superfamily)/2'-5' RNA ligase
MMLIRRLQDCEQFVAGDGSVLRELLHPDKVNVAIRYSLAHARVAPGESTKAHRLRTAEVYYILRGRGRMHIDAEMTDVDANCAIYIPPGSVQRISNIGKDDIIFLCIVDPAWREEDEEVMEGPKLIAADVVLLPDQATTRWIMSINRELVSQYGSEIVLTERTCLPHISLAMGCVHERDVDSIRELLQRLAKETPVRHLNATGIRISVNSRGEHTSLLEIERTNELQMLHEAVMREVEPLFTHDVTEAMIADDAVAESTLAWIRDFPQKAAFEQFSPHITLGYGDAKTDKSFPITLTVAQLALCHVGNHGTCRKVLLSVRLS